MAFEELARSMVFTRCLIEQQLCLVLVDGGRERNLISLRVVNKLGLQTQLHPKPYVFQSPYENKFSIIVSQVAVTFSIGQYEDQVLCDVIYNLPSSLVLGQPWFRDREVQFASQRSKKFRLRSRNKVFVLSSLVPEAAAEDLRVLQQLQEAYQLDLVSKALSKGSNSVPTLFGAGDPCLSPEKQSPNVSAPVDDEEGKLEPEAAVDASLEVEGRSEKIGEVLEQTDDERIVPMTRAAERPNSSTKQNNDEAIVGKPAGESSTCNNGTETFEQILKLLKTCSIELKLPALEDYESEISPLFSSNGVEEGSLSGSTIAQESTPTTTSESFKSSPICLNVDRFEPTRSELKTPYLHISGRSLKKDGQKIDELVGTNGDDSKQSIASETINSIPGVYLLKKIEVKLLPIDIPNSEFLVRDEKKNDENIGESVCEIERDSIERKDIYKFLEVQRSFPSRQFVAEKPESKIPNCRWISPVSGFMSLETGNFKFPDGGKHGDIDWRRFACVRRAVEDGIDSWRSGSSIGSNEFDQHGPQKKSPISKNSPESLPAPDTGNFWPEFVRLPNPILGQNFVNFCVAGESWTTTKALEQIDAEFEAGKLMAKIVSEKPSFDPILDQFCERFSKETPKC